MVERQSAPCRNLVISVIPRAMDPNMTLLWDMDLSPGMVTVPFNGPDLENFIKKILSVFKWMDLLFHQTDSSASSYYSIIPFHKNLNCFFHGFFCIEFDFKGTIFKTSVVNNTNIFNTDLMG